MRLTTMTDYALRLLMYVAQRPERLCTISEVAGAYGISEAHLMKVTHQLGLGRLAGNGARQGRRHAPGGRARRHQPRRRGAQHRAGFLPRRLPGNDAACMLTGRCRLTGIVSGALQSFMQHLDRHTLADLLPATAKVAANPSGRTRPVTFAKRLPVAAS